MQVSRIVVYFVFVLRSLAAETCRMSTSQEHLDWMRKVGTNDPW